MATCATVYLQKGEQNAKKAALFILLSLSVSGLVVAEEPTNSAPEFDGVPATIEEYVELRNEVATKPEGGAAMFVLAMLMYVADNKPGLWAFTVALDS